MKSGKRFTAEQRIRKQDAFKNLVEKGTFARGRFFYLWAGSRFLLDIKTEGRPMLGVVVNKKTQALATKRNLLKRRMREAFRNLQHNLLPDTAVLIKAREGSSLPGQKETEKDLKSLFEKTGVLL